ncbi:hypothetical protein [Bordetella petrii]|uniref:hypothetical protein n=1 Tax=Bordetella petrii TaxID=94624 RepID=UPI001E29ACF3|nr:hypothetical protein [Bordetella petrii]MCD0501873.1 hypothetical protein [Bordetella petrii]
MFRTVLACGALVLAAGCSGPTINAASVPPAGPSAVLDPALAAPGPQRGTVRIARDSGAWNSGKTVRIYLDGRHVANGESNRRVDLHVPVGAHNLGVQVDEAGQPIHYQDVNVQAGETYDFGISASAFGGEWEFMRLK